MIQANINKVDLKRVQSKLDKASRDFVRGAYKKKVPAAMALPIFEISQRLVPVDEADLKNSGGIVSRKEKTYIQYTEKHAVMQEYGSSENPKQPFLRPAIEQGKTLASKAAEDELIEQLKKSLKR